MALIRPIQERSGWQRCVLCSFGDEGVSVHLCRYQKRNRSLIWGRRFFFWDMGEREFLSNTRIRLFFRMLYFPFSYRVVATVSRKYCRSSFCTITAPRSHPREYITEQELTSVLSHNLTSVLEKRKREFSHQQGHDDSQSLLVGSRIVHVSVDGRELLQGGLDMKEKRGKIIRIGLFQSFLSRSLFSSFRLSLPRRALWWGIGEDGFSEALSILERGLYEKPNKRSEKFILVTLSSRKSDIFFYSGDSLEFFDTFRFGWRTLYDSLHHELGIDLHSFLPILRSVYEGEASKIVSKHIHTLVEKELARFLNGITSFTKTVSPGEIYIDAGPLSFIFSKHQKLSRWVVKEEDFWFGGVGSNKKVTFSLLSDFVSYAPLRETTPIDHTARKLVRWLIPQSIIFE